MMVFTQSPASASHGHPHRFADASHGSSRDPAPDAELHLAETRHRLANCLTLINGLIGVRLRGATDSESRRHLKWLLDVVTSLGVLQQRLIERKEDDFALYLDDVAEFWKRCGADRNVAITVEAESLVLVSARFSSLALIVHELISNAFEHAFPQGHGGNLNLSLRREDEIGILVIRDDGRGFSAEASSESGTGLMLVRSLVARLGGEVEIKDRAGAAVIVRFPLSDSPGNQKSTTEVDGYGCVVQSSKII